MYPLICTECREHIFDADDRRVGTPHCFDDDTDEPVGTLNVDYSYDWRYDDPRIA